MAAASGHGAARTPDESSQPRIALVVGRRAYPNLGGVEQHVRSVARELRDRGYAVEVWTVRATGRAARRRRRDPRAPPAGPAPGESGSIAGQLRRRRADGVAGVDSGARSIPAAAAPGPVLRPERPLRPRAQSAVRHVARGERARRDVHGRGCRVRHLDRAAHRAPAGDPACGLRDRMLRLHAPRPARPVRAGRRRRRVQTASTSTAGRRASGRRGRPHDLRGGAARAREGHGPAAARVRRRRRCRTARDWRSGGDGSERSELERLAGDARHHRPRRPPRPPRARRGGARDAVGVGAGGAEPSRGVRHRRARGLACRSARDRDRPGRAARVRHPPAGRLPRRGRPRGRAPGGARVRPRRSRRCGRHGARGRLRVHDFTWAAAVDAYEELYRAHTSLPAAPGRG